jgi:hypothetical protein
MVTPNEKAKHGRRRNARRHLNRLISVQQGRCHWCNAPIARPKNLAIVLRRTSDKVYYQDSHGEQWAYIATVDHVHPLEAGGDNSPQTLVAACLPCNSKRARAQSASPKTLQERHTCPKCGQWKPRGRRKCDLCRRGNRATSEAIALSSKIDRSLQ